MNFRPGLLGLLLGSMLSGCGPGTSGDGPAESRPDVAASSGAPERPNIVLIVADDLGYSDLGVFGSEIPTPNLDALAREGMVLRQFYANMACSPTRAMLFSGSDSHVAGLGVMGAPANPAQQGQPGYEGYLNFNVASLANLLQDAGYRTYMTGKWHLGRDVETGPRARGFDRSFVSIDGAAHLGPLSWNGPGLAPYRDGEDMVTVAEDFYTTQFYTERMIDYVAEGDAADDAAPFFAYLAYTAPHWPLQAPAESIARFAGWYDDGWEALYQRRLARARELGVVAADFAGIPPIAGEPAWETLSPEQQRIESRKMEIYAAMVSDLDRYIGEFTAYLEQIGELDNTLIFFISDNGPENQRRELAPGTARWVEACCNNAFENMGAGDSYLTYGPSWARAGTVAHRGSKSTGFEGGIRVPAFAWFPDRVPAGSSSDELTTVMDLLPTFIDIAGSEHPAPEYRGQPVIAPHGNSLLSLLEGGSLERMPGYSVGWELYGHRSVRVGDWKIVFDPREQDAAAWHLFNLAADPGEQQDLAATEPEKLLEMQAAWSRYAQANGVILTGR